MQHLFSSEDLNDGTPPSPPFVPSAQEQEWFDSLSEVECSIIVALSKTLPYYNLEHRIRVEMLKTLLDCVTGSIDENYAPNEWSIETVINALNNVNEIRDYCNEFIRYSNYRNMKVNKTTHRKDRNE